MELPRILTQLPGPRARAVIERDARVVSPSYTRPYPFVAHHGEGAIIEDIDGNRFLDFTAGIAVVATGHCHPRVVEAIQRQSAQLIHMSGTDFYYESMVDLAEKLASIAPGGGAHKVYFGNSGTEAIEAAIKLARYATGRDKFISFFGAFHGRTMGSLSLTASRYIQRKGFGPLLPGVYHAPYPYPYRSGKSPRDCAADALNYIEDTLFRTVLPPTEVAGIVVEPIQGEGGYIVPPPEFLPGLSEIARRHGILLIVDEVQSGMGRTGRWWACEHFNAAPDIVAVAKGIASGKGGLITNATRVGGHMISRLRDWPARYRHVGEVRGLGLMIGIEIVQNQQSRERAPELRDRIGNLAFERGLLVLGAGPNSLRLSPPLCLTEAQANLAVDILEDCLRSIEA